MQSVIVSTYNKPHHLSLVLEGLLHQEHTDFEVIVTDDGSTDDTRQLIDACRDRASFRLQHAWQEDKGFRAAKVRNLGLKMACGDQVVFLDGDCVPFPGFLKAHAKEFSDETMLAGDRLFLEEEDSAKLTPEQVANQEFMKILPAKEYKDLRKRAWKDVFYNLTRLKERPKVVTANLSCPRAALEAVNGLDENFVGWGHEDEDLRRRLKKHGLKAKSVFRTALVCHIWHPTVDSFRGRVKFGDNAPYYNRGYWLTRCSNGLKKLAPQDYRLNWGQGSQSDAPIELKDLSKKEHLGPYGKAEIRVAYFEEEAGLPSQSVEAAKASHLLFCAKKPDFVRDEQTPKWIEWSAAKSKPGSTSDPVEKLKASGGILQALQEQL